MAKIKTKRVIVKSELDPGIDAIETGERIIWGGKERKVYRIEEPITKVVPLVDPQTGGRMYKRGAAGQTLNSVHTERVDTGEVRVREFIVDDLGNGKTERIFKGFRPDPRDAERKEREKRRQKLMDEIVDRAEAAGGFDALLEDVATTPAPKTRKAAA